MLRSTKTKLYYRDAGEWTEDRIAARDFRSGAHAIPFVMKAGLKDVEVVLAFDDPNDDILLPIGSTASRPAARA